MRDEAVGTGRGISKSREERNENHRMEEIEVKTTLKNFGILLIVLSLSLSVLAQGNSASKSPRMVFAQSAAHARVPYVNRNAGLKTIYSNLATKNPNGLYFALEGDTEQGPFWGAPAWNAVPFTPTFNANVTTIELPLGYIFSFSSTDVLVSLNADNGGLPGDALQTWVVTIDTGIGSGTCCSVYAETGSVPVTAGQQYWVVVSTESDSDMYVEWNVNTTDELDEVTNAYYDGTGWYTYSTTNGAAVGVYGTKTK